MNATRTIAAALGAAVLLWAGTAAQQEVRDRPGFGSGIMDVRVVNHPAVTATQNGEWRVSLANVADVRIANAPTVTIGALPFVRSGFTYQVTWPGQRVETVTVRELGGGGWVRVTDTRWINLENAESVASR